LRVTGRQSGGSIGSIQLTSDTGTSPVKDAAGLGSTPHRLDHRRR
jgi:hypothetical protein